MQLLPYLLALLLSIHRLLSAENVSVIIPCSEKHFSLLPELLEALADQTMPPGEVVISLSSAEKVAEERRNALLLGKYPFSLKLLCSRGVKYAGVNRNIAAKAANGEVIITQDADDLPHRQRVEITCYLLEKYGALQLLHQWFPPEEVLREMAPSDVEQLPKWKENYIDFDSLEVTRVERPEIVQELPWLHNGNIGLKRKITEALQWPRDKKGQDLKFNIAAVKKFRNSLFVKIPLVIYRNSLSSHKHSI